MSTLFYGVNSNTIKCTCKYLLVKYRKANNLHEWYNLQCWSKHNRICLLYTSNQAAKADRTSANELKTQLNEDKPGFADDDDHDVRELQVTA